MGLKLNQIKVLVKKDFWILKTHKRALCAEIAVPLFMALLAGLMLHALNNSNQGAWYNEYSITNETRISAPIGLSHCSFSPKEPFQTAGFNVCQPIDFGHGYNMSSNQLFHTETEAMAEYNSYNGSEMVFTSSVPSLHNSAGFGVWGTKFGEEDLIDVKYSGILAKRALQGAPALYAMYNPMPTINDNIFVAAEFNGGQLWSNIISFLLSIALLPLVISTAGRLVDEKRCKMREHLRVMGVQPSAYLLSVFGFGTVRVLMVCIIMMVTFVLAQNMIPVWDCFAAIVTLFIYGHTMIAFSLLMPCLFSRSSFSSGATVLFMSGGQFAAVYCTSLPAAAQIALALVFAPITNFMGVAQALGRFSIHLPVTPAMCMVFLVLQLVGYCALSQYLYNLFPGEYGVSQHALYPFYQLKRFLSGEKKESARRSGAAPPAPGDLQRSEAGGAENDGGPVAQQYSIVLDNLFKYYGSQRDTAAVNGLSLKIKKGEIFALLGHNGAGKTTTISMLTGMLESTQYDFAEVDGLDLEKDVDLIRHKICVCPQFDILFEDLSGPQHMEIFATLKGVTADRGQTVLSRLGLPLSEQASVTYSGGMKRRLSVACAMIGGSPIVFLDEPSSGLDPMSRRQLWDMIREERNQGKTIVLTTHFMEEADYLGERIGIMSHGKLFCCDTSLALKQEHGVGYYLTLVKEVVDANSEKQTFDTQAVLATCDKFCPGASVIQDSLGDACFLLPTEHLNAYGDLMLLIDEKKAEMGISSYGIRMNSLEDVFVNISEKENSKDDPLDMAQYQTDTLTTTGVSVEDMMSKATYDQSSLGRFFSQFCTIFRKKRLFLQRSKRMWFLGIGVPVIMVFLCWLAVIPQGSGEGTFDTASGKHVPDYSNWKIPVVGVVTPQQQDMLDKVAALFEVYGEFFPGATSGMPLHIDYYYADFGLARLGGYVDTKSIAFDRLEEKFAVALTMTPATDEVGSSTDLVHAAEFKGQPYHGRSVGISANNEFQPFIAVHFMWLIHMARAEQDGLPAVFPNITTEELAPARGVTVPPITFCVGETCGKTYIMLPVGIFMAILCAQYSANAGLQVADELNRHIFHTMRMHGLSSLAYWTATFVFDMTITLVIVVGMIIGPYARDVGVLQSAKFLVFQSLVVFGDMAFTLLFTYSLMCAFPNLKPNTYLTLVLALTLAMMLVPAILSVLPGVPSSMLWDVIFPPKAVVSIYGLTHPSQAFDNRTAGFCLLSIWAWCLPPLLGIWIFSTGVFRKNRSPKRGSEGGMDDRPLLSAGRLNADADVVTEMKRVEGHPADDMVEGIHLQKVYKGGKMAVKDMTFGLRVGECFGLLGPNGAGKTTTVKMLLKEHAATNGALSFPYATGSSQEGGSVDLDKDYRVCRMGVCQQHDTLWETFSDQEHLDLYLRIRLGTYYVAADWKQYITNAIAKVYLEAEGKGAEEYSGGMKRKLAVAIALYTGARTIFLDEPSTGMDPYARRAMWKSINEALANDRCVLLTTHSMEEADAVCARIAIVTDGSMQCIGSGQHLKNKFGKGYSITLLLQAPNLAAGAPQPTGQQMQQFYESQYGGLTAKMTAMFGNTVKQDEAISNNVRYSIANLNIARAFQQLSQVSAEWHLESYSVNQVTSLEQIFLGFAGNTSNNQN